MSNWVASLLAYHPELAGLAVVKRARRSLHLQLPGGEVLGQFTGAPCHYQRDGQWLPLDTALQLDSARNEYGAPGLRVRLSPAGLVRVMRGADPDSTLHRQQTTRVGILDIGDGSLSQVKTLGGGLVDGDSLVRSLGGGVEHRLRLTETGLRETLTLAQALPGGDDDQWLVLETAFPDCDWPDGWIDGDLAAGVQELGAPTGTDANGNDAPCRRYAKKRGGTQFLYTGVPLSWLASATYPVVFDPDFAADASDGYIWGQNTISFANARATATASSDTATALAVGQRTTTTPLYCCYRSFVSFDTSSIGAAATILQVNLVLAVIYDFSTYDDFDVQIVKHAWDAPLANYREADYDGCLSGPADDSIWRNTAGIATSTPLASGNLSTAWPNKTGMTSYSLRSNKDAEAIDIPGGYNRNEYVQLASATHGTEALRPVLQVLYAAGGGLGPIANYYRRRRVA
jgi:hypothetical protein